MDNNFVKIVGYDAEGNAHVLFGIENDKTTEEKSPMPSLETGMFIRLEFNGIKETEIGFIYNDNIIWQNGGWDNTYDIHVDEHYNNTENDLAYLTIYEVNSPYYFPKKEKSEYEYRKIIWEGEVYYG